MLTLDERVEALTVNDKLSITKTASERYPWTIEYIDRYGKNRSVTGDAAFVLGILKLDRVISDDA